MHLPPLLASFNLKNGGKGPALIEQGVALLSLGQLPAIGDYSVCIDLEMQETAMAAGELASQLILFKGEWVGGIRSSQLTQSEYESVRDKHTQLTLYGRVRYRDVFKNLYETSFCWLYMPAGGFVLNAFCYRGPADRNTYT